MERSSSKKLPSGSKVHAIPIQGKENTSSAADIAALDNQHELMKKKAQEMFADLDFNDDESFNDSKDKPDFTATQLMDFNNKKRN